MHITWYEQREADVPAHNDWLSLGEMARLSGMRFPKRRAEWRLGRWTAKCAVSSHLGLVATSDAFQKLDIRASASGAPEVLHDGGTPAVTISLSHRSGIAACAVATACPNLVEGCDIERIEPHSDVFLTDYFTFQEQALVRGGLPGDRDLLVALLWSAKESMLKALNLGLRADTRSVSVKLESADIGGEGRWQVLRVEHVDFGSLHGWWRNGTDFVRTLVAGQLHILNQSR